MTRRLPLLFVLAGLALVTASTMAHAQGILLGQIPFSFVAGGRVHDPGRYELRTQDDQLMISLIPEGKGQGGMVPVITRLASPAGGLDNTRLVFDKVGNTYFLSEVWIAGEDGFLLHATPGPHTHATIQLGRTDR
jgi:hypothetical protein